MSSEDAARRLAEHGPNELAASGRISPWSLLLAQFKNVLILILLVAVGLSALLGHALEAVVIAVIVLFAVVLGFVQEYRAERAIEGLREWPPPSRPCCATARSRTSRRASWCRATSFCSKRATGCPPTRA